VEIFGLLLLLLFFYCVFGVIAPLLLVLLFVGFIIYEQKKFESERKQIEDKVRQRISNSSDPSAECSKICAEALERSEEINRQWEESQRTQSNPQFNFSDFALGWVFSRLFK
jgi:predicted membrane protein